MDFSTIPLSLQNSDRVGREDSVFAPRLRERVS